MHHPDGSHSCLHRGYAGRRRKRYRCPVFHFATGVRHQGVFVIAPTTPGYLLAIVVTTGHTQIDLEQIVVEQTVVEAQIVGGQVVLEAPPEVLKSEISNLAFGRKMMPCSSCR